MIQNVSIKTDKGIKLIDTETLGLLLENYVFLYRLHKTQARLLNIRLNEVVKQTTAAITKSATSVGLRKVPSLVVDVDEETTSSNLFQSSGAVYTKLFGTYSLEKYTNALISFKLLVNKHWLAKNMLTIGSDAQILKNMLVPNKPQKRVKSDTLKSPRDSGSREDSIILDRKSPKNKRRISTGEVGQELESILRKIETGPISPTHTALGKESTVQVTQAQISMHQKKSSFYNSEHLNDE